MMRFESFVPAQIGTRSEVAIEERRPAPGDDERLDSATETRAVDADVAVERERLAAAIADQEQMARALRSLREQLDQRARAVLESWSEALANGARAALPSIVREGALAEIAASVRSVAGAGPASDVTVRVAPSERDALSALLARHIELTILADPGMPEGRAAVDWHEGGATIDAERLAEAALGVLDHHLKVFPAETADERD